MSHARILVVNHDHPDPGVTTSNMETDLVENITKPEGNIQFKCDYCGYTKHGIANTVNDRKNNCKALGSICSTCNIPNHFSTMCWSRDMSQQLPNTKEGRPTQQGHDSRVDTSPLMHSSDWMYDGLAKKTRPKICVG